MEDSVEVQCNPFKHDWEEVYYGYECKVCKQFVPFGGEYWAPDESDWVDWNVDEEDDLNGTEE